MNALGNGGGKPQKGARIVLSQGGSVKPKPGIAAADNRSSTARSCGTRAGVEARGNRSAVLAPYVLRPGAGGPKSGVQMGAISSTSLVLAAILAAAWTSPLRAQATTRRARLAQAVDAAVSNEAAIACLVVQRGKVLLERGAGQAPESRDVVSAQALFDAGPLAETFTAVAALRLSMAGTLALDAPIGRHLPDLPKSLERVTLRHLLTHSAGLPPKMDFVPAELTDRGRFIARVVAAAGHVRPGRYVKRSRFHYALAAALIERAARRQFEEVIRIEVLRPAGLDETGFVGDITLDRRRAVARFDGDGKRVGNAILGEWDWAQRGHTGIVTTARDLQRWNAALHGDALLDAPHREQLFLAFVGDQALGWQVETADNDTLLVATSGGAAVGFRSRLTYHAPQDTLVVLLGTAGAPVDALADQLAQIALAAEVGPNDLHQFVGRYRIDSQNEFDVATVDGALRIRSLGQQASSRLYHGQPTMPEWPKFYAEVAERAPVLLRPMLHKDLASFTRSFHKSAPEGAAEAAVDLIAKLERQHGRIGRAQLLGTRSGTSMHSWFRVALDRAAVTLRVEWHGELFHRVVRADADFPLTVELLSVTTAEFAASSMDGKGSIRVAFKIRGDAPATGLRFFDKSKSGKRGLRCRRIRSHN